MASTAQDSSAPLRTEKKDEDVDESAFFLDKEEREEFFFSLSLSSQCRSRNHAKRFRARSTLLPLLVIPITREDLLHSLNHHRGGGS